MKRTPFLLAILCLSLLFSCKKDSFSPYGIQLEKVQFHYNGNVNTTSYQFDNQGRITSISHTAGVQTDIVATVFYNGSEVLIVNGPVNSSAAVISDSIWLTLDMEHKPLTRIRHQHYDFFPPTNADQRTFIGDTSTYTYDGSGLLKKTITKSFDTTWTQNAIHATRSAAVTDYTVNAGNLISSETNTAISSWTKQSSVVINTSSTKQLINNYSYVKNYSNRMDFSNIAVLNEYNTYLPFPLNSSYTNLPDKVSITEIDRDQFGTIYHNFSGHVDFIATFDPFGFLSTMMNDPSTPEIRTEFFYRK